MCLRRWKMKMRNVLTILQINEHSRCDLYGLFAVLRYARHVLKKNKWGHKSASNKVLDIAVNYLIKYKETHPVKVFVW